MTSSSILFFVLGLLILPVIRLALKRLWYWKFISTAVEFWPLRMRRLSRLVNKGFLRAHILPSSGWFVHVIHAVLKHVYQQNVFSHSWKFDTCRAVGPEFEYVSMYRAGKVSPDSLLTLIMSNSEAEGGKEEERGGVVMEEQTWVRRKSRLKKDLIPDQCHLQTPDSGELSLCNHSVSLFTWVCPDESTWPWVVHPHVCRRGTGELTVCSH